MSRSARQKLNDGESSYFEFVGEYDGNAARTRPLHFDEIMLRRKKRELSPSGNNDNISKDKPSKVDSVERVSTLNKDCKNSESALEQVRLTPRSEVEKVKSKNEDDNKFTKEGNRSEVKMRKIIQHPELFSKEITDNIEKHVSTRKGVLVKGNDEEAHAPVTKFRTRLSSEVRYKDDRDYMSNQDKAVGRIRNELNVLGGRDHMMEPNVKQRYTNRIRGRSDGETKRMRRDLVLGMANDRYGAKPDPRRLRDIDTSQRRILKEYTESRYGEINAKKKLSGSREHGKGNNRRLLSLSPRGQRRQLDNGRRHEDYPSKSLKERSSRQLDVADKSRFSSNGSGKRCHDLDVSSGEHGRHSQRKRKADKTVKTPSPTRRSPERKTSSNYRGHEVSKSALGGYSPRKRRSDQAVKTPPPSKQSPERKVAGWDIAPTSAQVIPAGPPSDAFPLSSPATFSNVHELTDAVSAALSVMKPSVAPSLNFPTIKLSASIDSVQLTESTRPMRRLYVENIPASASEKALMQCLNSNLLSAGANHIHGTQPCISCIIHQEKGLALVEFLTPEDASSALSLDGYPFCGAILKVRRPKDFVEVATSQTIDARKEAAVHIISNTVDDSPHKIFIGGISEVLASDMLLEIAGVFGLLKGFHFVVAEDATERCAFLEYMDPSATLKACAALNGLNLGGQVLTVVRADSSSSEIDGNLPQYAIPSHAMPLLQKPTRVLKLRNVFPPDSPMLLSQKEMDEIIEDVRVECARFGLVKLVNVVKHDVYVPLMPDDYVVADDTVQNIRAEEGDLAEKVEEYTEHKSGVTQTSTFEIIGDRNCNVVPREREAEHQIVAIKFFDGEETPRRDENYPVIDGYGDRESRMCHPDTEGNINEETYQILSGQPVAGETMPMNNLDDGCCNQDIQECDVTPCKDNHVEEKTPGKQELYTDEDERKSSPYPEHVGASMMDTNIQKSVNEELLPDLSHILQPGCVLVEYKRIESSREAAHCLHGRLFDDRMVTVEYVPEDLYVAKFGKI